MSGRLLLPLIALLAIGAPPEDDRTRLMRARAESTAAADRAEALETRAAQERDAAAKAQAQEQAVAARIASARADIDAARARIAIVDARLVRARAALGKGQAPVARLLGSLTALARRPAIAAIAQPGSVDDLVHVRAVLGSTLPVVRRQTVALRTQVDETRTLRAAATVAAASLRAAQTRLVQQRQALEALQATHSGNAQAFARDALRESDRALAMGEDARDLVDRIAGEDDRAQTIAALERLPGPPAMDATATRDDPIYRLPVIGRLTTGWGEISDTGVRSRGLTFAVGPGEQVVAPAAGRVVFARPFRGYDGIVILDHGNGWTTLLTGLGASVARGSSVEAGAPLGRATTNDDPRVTVELRHQGRPVDIARMIG